MSFTRLDDDTTAAPGRFVSSIFIDPADANHAWISYMGFDLSTPATPGHVFEVPVRPGDRAVDLDEPVVRLRRPAGEPCRVRRAVR